MSTMKWLKSRLPILIGLLVSLFFITMYVNYATSSKESVGSKVVQLLYTFEDVYQLADQDEELKKITTESAYKKLTATDVDKALNTYLKFKQESAKVRILREHSDNKGGYVLYTIDSNAISANRLFLLLYDLDKGKLDNPRELEGIDFYRGES